MKHLIIALALAAVAGSTFARSAPASAPDAANAAATPTQPGTPQRSKMKVCNADARTKSLHGDERRAFMKQCLSGKAKPSAS